MRAPVVGALLSTLFAAGVLGLTSCRDLTSVDAPDVVQPGDYASAAGATALAAGAVTQFNLAFGGTQNPVNPPVNQVVSAGQIADELFATSVHIGGAWDNRNAQDPFPGEQVYGLLHRARVDLITAIASFQRAAPDSSARIGQLFALVGYTSLFFGENFCAGVPLSRRDAELRPVYGLPLTTTQLFDSALAAFDSALVHGAQDARVADLARVGKARALLNQGRFGEAATAAASVPTTYAYDAVYVTGTLFNGLYGTGTQRLYTVPEREGANGLDWRTAGDPRAVLVNRSPGVIGADGVTEMWQFAQYQASNAPVRLAGGIEARLVEAEAALQAGDAGTWLGIHNTLRSTVSGLDPLADPGTTDARVDLHFRERAFWLFLTGHRHGDLRRLVRQYGRDAESVFPTGEWREGVTYGTATSIAPPADARNNPNYAGCLNREA